jgi:hypothetical protein
MICECWKREVDIPETFPYKSLDILRLFGAGKQDMLGACGTTKDAVHLLGEVLNSLGERVLDLPE